MEINNNNQIRMNSNIEIEDKQNKFLETTLGKTINTAIDIGIRSILPDFIEGKVINIKDNLLNYGLKEGIDKTVKESIELGKNAIGIFTGNFENVVQAQSAVRTSGLVNGVSSLLDTLVDKVKEVGLIDNNVANLIKQGKSAILNNMQNNIEKNFNRQLSSVENLEVYMESWNKDFVKKDFSAMEKSYKNIEKEIKNIIPLENLINKVRGIENLHILIKNNGQDFNLTNEQIELANKLI